MIDLRKLFKAALALTATAALLSAGDGFAQTTRRPKPGAADLSKPAATGAQTPAPAPSKAADAGTTPNLNPKTLKAPSRTLDIKVTEKGYEPAKLSVKKGEPVRLRVTRTTEQTCANEILVQGTDVNVPLPLNQPVEI